jgi:hypothetical protein
MQVTTKYYAWLWQVRVQLSDYARVSSLAAIKSEEFRKWRLKEVATES